MSKKTTRKSSGKKGKVRQGSISLQFTDNSLLPALYGESDRHLSKIEDNFNVVANSRGNMLMLTGDQKDVNASKDIILHLYRELERGVDVDASRVDAAIRMARPAKTGRANGNGHHFHSEKTDISIKTIRKTVQPYSHTQAEYLQALLNHDLVFALGPAGTGKTYLAVAVAVSMFIHHKVERIVLSRPAVEAGEKLGFLPGDLKEKIDPYLRPLYDALYEMIPGDRVIQHMENGEIEVAPLAFMRGRTLSNSFVILDEAQNTTPTQMKMFLTRMGENSRMVVTGDLSQTDLPKDVASGLRDAIRKVQNIEGISVVRFSDADVVRHPLAAKIVQAYDEWDRKKKSGQQPPEL